MMVPDIGRGGSSQATRAKFSRARGIMILHARVRPFRVDSVGSTWCCEVKESAWVGCESGCVFMDIWFYSFDFIVFWSLRVVTNLIDELVRARKEAIRCPLSSKNHTHHGIWAGLLQRPNFGGS